MNNPLRALIQERYEARILRSMSSIGAINSALEIGCGSGSGTRVIQKHFQPRRIVAIDLDERMVAIARRRNPSRAVSFQVMDASELGFPDQAFDAVFDFGILHHIPNWQTSLCEVRRVLKPGGELILEDLSIETFSSGIGRVWKRILDHPYTAMYTARQFTAFLAEIGFEVRHYREFNPLGLLRHFSLNAVNQTSEVFETSEV